MANEALIRLAAFLGIFVAVAIWESVSPKRKLISPKSERWLSNIIITLLGTAIVRSFFPVLAVTFAANDATLGILNQSALPYGFRVVIGVMFLDLVIYGQHVMFHSVPLLWRLHMMHHADLDIDVTTGLRFHPLEVLLSMGIKIVTVLVLGPPAIAVILFEILLNGTSMFNHGNIKMPHNIDRMFRLIVVTPDMHRVHHSVIIKETNSNFGFNFPLWDRIFGTYKAQPEAGHEGMTIGLSQFRNRKQLTFLKLLLLPFTEKPGNYPLIRSRRKTTS
jgi:sterol desaturase/sphingolipid hydroxylase (fatty acid hydroxylase superfamily)